MSSRRSASFPIGHVLVFTGAVLVLLGFFLPWITIRPSHTLGALTHIFGSALGSELGMGGLGRLTGGLTKSLVIHATGWKLATGISLQDLLPSNGLGDLIQMGASLDPKAAETLSTSLVPPLVWLFLFPLLAIFSMVMLFTGGGRTMPKPVIIIGGLTFFLIVAHILLFYVGIHAAKQNARAHFDLSSDEAILTYLGAALIKIQVGIGAWLTLLGSLLWTGGAAVAASAETAGSRNRRPPVRRSGQRTSLFGRRTGYHSPRTYASRRRSRFRR